MSDLSPEEEAQELLRSLHLDGKAAQGVELERFGTGWKTQIGDVSLEVSSVRESSREGIHAEIFVTDGKRRLRELALKLGSARSLSPFLRRLDAAFPSFPWSWETIMEAVLESVVERLRIGEPVEDLSSELASIHTPYLVSPILPADQTTILYGDGKSYKSLMALWLATAISLNQPLPGMKVQDQRPVLYLDWEADSDTHKRRLRRIAMGMEVGRPHIAYRRMYRSIADEVAQVRRIVDQLDAGLVVIDSLGWACGGDLVKNEIAIPTMNALREIPCTRLVIAHVSTDGAARRDAVPFGSRFFFNAARALWKVTRGSRGVTLTNRDTNDDDRRTPIGLSFEFDPESGPIRIFERPLGEDPNVEEVASARIVIRDFLEGGDPCQTTEIALGTGQPVATVRGTLNRYPEFRRMQKSTGRKSSLWTVDEPTDTPTVTT